MAQQDIKPGDNQTPAEREAHEKALEDTKSSLAAGEVAEDDALAVLREETEQAGVGTEQQEEKERRIQTEAASTARDLVDQYRVDGWKVNFRALTDEISRWKEKYGNGEDGYRDILKKNLILALVIILGP